MAYTEERRGHCIACGDVGPPGRTRDFLCELCANPQQIIQYCQRCKQRMEISPEALPNLRKHCPNLPNRLGLTMVVDCCLHCLRGDDAEVVMTFYGIPDIEHA